jgi:dihydroorotate dehydrogenase (fumarate)
MDLTTKYLGLDLAHPFMPGSSPMTDDLDTVKKLEDAGASALVMRSLFEEQLIKEEMATTSVMDAAADSFAEALSFFPKPDSFVFGPHEYLEQVRKIKDTVSVPVIASLNGVTPGRWVDYARQIEKAGADALELNVYFLARDAGLSGADLERQTLDLVKTVKKTVSIPVAVKLSPFYSALANFAAELDNIADGLVLFNRFYQPDIDVNNLEVKPELHLSNTSELLLRLRWLAVLSPNIKGSLAVTGGIHSAEGAIKAIMAGAHAVQMVSCILNRGPEFLTSVKDGVTKWLETNNYESLTQMQGSMNITNSPDPDAYERANYVQVLQSWKR